MGSTLPSPLHEALGPTPTADPPPKCSSPSCRSTSPYRVGLSSSPPSTLSSSKSSWPTSPYIMPKFSPSKPPFPLTNAAGPLPSTADPCSTPLRHPFYFPKLVNSLILSATLSPSPCIGASPLSSTSPIDIGPRVG